MSTLAYQKAYYDYARSLGLCGRCKKRRSMPDMAYCRTCHLYIRARNRKRQGEPKREVWSKFAEIEEAQ